MKIIHCAGCNQPIVGRASNARYCGDKCRYKQRHKKRTGVIVPETCLRCGVAIQNLNGRRKYCTVRCRDRAKLDRLPSYAASRRNQMLLKTYGITLEEYDAMVVAQDGQCAICKGKDPRSPTAVWSVDHCHISGKVRALLCSCCNRGLGQFQDDVSLVRKAVAYLEEHSRLLRA